LKILLTGRDGQVGWELERVLAPLGEVVATDRSTLDLGNEEEIRSVVRGVKPDVIVNAAAYTAVDKAESEPELAMRINGFAPGVLGEEAKYLGALLVHYSTDYVFDGLKATPYVEEDRPNPINVYGRSKLAGERAIVHAGCRHLILRTSWVYGARGNNFLLRIIALAAERSELKVVSDQFGAPTSGEAIARGTRTVLERALVDTDGLRPHVPSGVYHMTASGRTTWFEFASEALKVLGSPVRILPIPASEYPSRVPRPTNSLLSNEKLARVFDVRLPDWRQALESCLRSRSESQQPKAS